MLENLDRIDWGKLSHAYGPATDVPDQLLALASPGLRGRTGMTNPMPVAV